MYCAYITTIKELRKHSNADRLQCATIFGNNVIVDLTYISPSAKNYRKLYTHIQYLLGNPK